MSTSTSSADFAWTLYESGPQEAGKRTFSRPFGLLERCFYWDIRLDGTADVYNSVLIQVSKDKNPRDVFNTRQVQRAWVYTKHVHPLVGAQIQKEPEADAVPRFVVVEDRLKQVSADEIVFREVKSHEEVKDLVQQLIAASPRPMAASLPAMIYILSRTDGSNCVHFVSVAAHCIIDGIGNGCLLTTFLDALTSDLDQKEVPKLEKQLDLALPIDSLLTVQKLSPVKRRWKMAIAAVIATLRAEKLKGGHGLPRKFTTATPYTPAQSHGLFTALSPAETRTVMQTCRKHGITYGNAFYVICQVALARVLLRLFRRGEISPKEWDWRKRQHIITGGPLNMRPFLDPEWFNAGGKSAVTTSIGFFLLTLPFIPLGSTEKMKNIEEATFDDFLSPRRFVLRSNIVRKQMKHQLKHPLFHEVSNARLVPRGANNRALAVRWQDELEKAKGGQLQGQSVPLMEQGANGPVFACIGSTLGDLTSAIPITYPPLDPHNPVLQVESSEVRLHCRPTELYLGAATARNQLRFTLFWDDNVYERVHIKEWLDEVKAATLWYLGGEREKKVVTKDQPTVESSKL
jgi:hypothetical protein